MNYFEQSLVFTKMHVNGNDFLIVNGLAGKYSLEPSTVQHLGDRRTGLGFDQLLLIEHPRDTNNDVAVGFYNRDGTSTEQCGNGCAAVAAFLRKHQLVRESTIHLETSQRITECTIVSSEKKYSYTIDVDLGSPRLHPNEVPFLAKEQQTRYQINVPSQDKPLLLSVLSLGNPHAVVVVPNADHVQLDVLGPDIQRHESFPLSTNVEVLEIKDNANGKLRVFERGVGETRACGTGAAAAMVAGRLLNLFSIKVCMTMPGGSAKVHWKGPDNSVVVRCVPTFVFTGTLTLDNLS